MLHGPPGISSFFQGSEVFAWNQNFNITEYANIDLEYQREAHMKYKVTTQRVFEDENVRIHVISPDS